MSAPEPLTGRTHADVLALEPPAARELVEGLIPVGAVGVIAGVPESHKSWLAGRVALRVAAGDGHVLGCRVVTGGPVGYAWQDDSTAAEVERVKLMASAYQVKDAPVHWFLNEGIRLPEDLPRLRATIEKLGLVLLVLDSFYNFLGGSGLRDEGAEQVVAALKQEIADPTGCTILLVDHLPWATETNRQRLRPYGGVFKAAATRFGVYIDAVGSKLWIEARGNNIAGFHRTPAYWDADSLELRLVEHPDRDAKLEERAQKVFAYLDAAGCACSKRTIRKAVGGRAETTDRALELLESRDTVIRVSAAAGTLPDTAAAEEGWIAASHAAPHGIQTVSHPNGTHPDTHVRDPDRVHRVPVPVGDTGTTGHTPEKVSP